MDIYPRTEAQRRAVSACLAKTGIKFAPNPGHRCGGSCSYFRFGRVAVCRSSLHTHLCGPGVCTDPSLHIQTPEGTTCTLTGLVVAGPQEVLAPKISADGSFKRHWEIDGAHPARVKRRKAQAKTDAAAKLDAAIESTCRTIFASPERAAAAEKAAKKAGERAARAMPPGIATLDDMMQAVASECRAAGNAAVAATNSEHDVRRVAAVVKAATRLITGKGFKSKNAAITAAAILSLMQDGFEVDGCVMVEKHPFSHYYLPTQAQLGTMAGLQCRAITLAIRAIKRFMVTPRGEPLPQRAITIQNYRRLLSAQ